MVHFYDNKEDVPEGLETIKDNVSFFLEVTRHKVDNSVDTLLTHTDKCKYSDAYNFTSRFGQTQPWYWLSTGGMTVLNAYYNPDKVFDGVEAGPNTLIDATLLDRGRFCNAAPWSDSPNLKMDLEYNGVVYHSVEEALDAY